MEDYSACDLTPTGRASLCFAVALRANLGGASHPPSSAFLS